MVIRAVAMSLQPTVVFQSRNTTLSNVWHTEIWGKRCVYLHAPVLVRRVVPGMLLSVG